MNAHKNARLTVLGRQLLVQRVAQMGLRAAAEAAGVSLRTARKWLKRFEQGGVQALADRSSRPRRTRSSIDEELGQRIEQLRRGRMPMRRIAQLAGRSVSTVARWLARQGLSSLRAFEPPAVLVRYEHAAAGDLLHMDTKKLGCIVRVGHRATGNRRDTVEGAGWEFVHVAIDDHSRASFVQMHGDERKSSASQFLRCAVAHYAAQGVRIKRLLTDTARRTARRSSTRPAKPWASATCTPAPIRRRPTARPSGSSRRACANGPMAAPGPTALSAPLGCRPSSTTTTTAGHTRPSASGLPPPDSAGTTYRPSTASPRRPRPGELRCSALPWSGGRRRCRASAKARRARPRPR